MSSNFLKRIGISASALAGIALAAGVITFRAQADEWDKMTLLTVDEPTQVSNTYLEPGTYMLKLANSDRHIVQIFTKDRSHLINTIIAIPSYRLNVTDKSQFTFWETPPGTARAVRMWFYPGDHDGQEFRYPTDLRQIAFVTPVPVPAPAPPPPVPESVVTPPPAESEPAPQAVEQAPPPQQEPVEIAQNTPPPNNVPPPPAPPPQPTQPEDQTLPKTASPYPLFGLGGLAALGLYALLRFKTVA
jgi:hypothetical protein